MRNIKIAIWILAVFVAITGAPAVADQVFLDDVIVDGSLCVGVDCVNGESFGFDTIRLKENNLRIKFQDTSTSASFPSNDWQITANDSSNGGANKFSIEDIDGGRTVFTILAGAPANALFVNASGNLGLGTSTPVVEIEIKDGDTPTLRLCQDGSSGFTPQTWDVAGNETNFFIRDVTNGSKLPFRIRPNSATSALDVHPDGIGIFDSNPDSELSIRAITAANQDLLTMSNNGSTRFRMYYTSQDATGNNWSFNANTNDHFLINSNLTADNEFDLDEAGNLEVLGTLTPMSSRAAKTDFTEVDSRVVLQKVVELPIAEWTYKADDPNRRHMGPVAEDFYAAFGLGKDDKGISVTDSAGVALAAIQALHAELEELRATNTTLQERLEALEK